MDAIGHVGHGLAHAVMGVERDKNRRDECSGGANSL